MFVPAGLAPCIHITSKFEIKGFFEVSVNIEIAEWFGRVLKIQPQINGPILAKYFHVIFSVDKVVQQNGVGSDFRLIIRATLLQADEISKYSLCCLLN